MAQGNDPGGHYRNTGSTYKALRNPDGTDSDSTVIIRNDDLKRAKEILARDKQEASNGSGWTGCILACIIFLASAPVKMLMNSEYREHVISIISVGIIRYKDEISNTSATDAFVNANAPDAGKELRDNNS